MTRRSDVGVSVTIPVRGASASLAVKLSVLAAPFDAPPFVLVLGDNGRNGDLRGACLRRVRDGGCCGPSGKRRVVTASSARVRTRWGAGSDSSSGACGSGRIVDGGRRRQPSYPRCRSAPTSA